MNRYQFLTLFMLLSLLLLAVSPAFAQEFDPDRAPWGTRGQEALSEIGPEIDYLAAKYGFSTEQLVSMFLTDSNLWIDSQGNLMYLDEFVPEDRSPGITPAGPYPYSETFLLHSLPGASKVIYLDFDGHATTGTLWNNGRTDPIISEPFDLDGNPSGWNNAEMDRIQYIWQRVAEDYIIYGVDVTTQDPGIEGLRKTSTSDQYYGQRVVISPTNWYSTNAGGVAYIGSFNWDTDTPTYAFTAQLGGGNEKYTAEASSHEVGHTVGLAHDGTTAGVTYYQGHGNWAPIMGVGYYKEIVQFSKGEYALANMLQDDLQVMTGYGFTFRPDDHGSTRNNATPLLITSAVNASGSGIIEFTTDKDYFSFLTGAGTVTLNANPAPNSPNLDILAELYDASGTLIASSNPTSLNASISLALDAGTYYLALDGIGTGDPSTGYSDYASIGQFSISGTIVDPGTLQPPVAAASASPTSGNAPLSVIFSSSGSSDPDGTITGWSWNFGDGTSSSDENPSHTYTVKGVHTAALTVTDDDGLSDSDSVTITVTAPPAAPTALSASAVSYSQINLTWVDNANDETGYRVERSLGGAGSFSVVVTLGANAASYSDTGVSSATTYNYRVQAYNAYGDSVYSNVATATTPPPPAVIDHYASADLPVSGTLNGSYQATWTNDGVTQAITEISSGGKPASRYSYLEHKWSFPVSPGYSVTFFANAWAPANSDGDQFLFSYSTDNSTFTNMFFAGASDSGYQTFALPNTLTGTVYIRVVDSNRSAGKIGLDTLTIDEMFIRTNTTPPVAPSAPTALSATPVSASQIGLSWTDNANNETGNRIERSLDGGANWVNAGTTGANSTTFTDAGLAANTTYTYRVFAFHSAGDSPPSNLASATTLAPSGMHVSVMSGASSTSAGGKWNATVTIYVHDANDNPVEGVVVSGNWGNGASGSASCTTNASGNCTVTKANLKATVSSVSFSVSGLSKAGYSYDPATNHLSSITVNKP